MTGVQTCALPIYDAPTQLVKPRERNTRLSFLSLLVRLAVASFIGLSLLNYDFFCCYWYYLTKGSVLMHLVICYFVFFSINFQLDVILFLGCQIEVKIII